MAPTLVTHQQEVDSTPTYAVVQSWRMHADGCLLLVQGPTGREGSIDFGHMPDFDGAEQLLGSERRALSVSLLLTDDETARCSVLLTSRSGPERLAVSPAVALALCLQDRRTVVVRTLDSGRRASTQM